MEQNPNKQLLNSEIQQETAWADQANTLVSLGKRLNVAKDIIGSIEAFKKALDIYRRLAKANPAAYEPDLARSLNNLSNRLSDVGDREGALEAIREAVDIRRRLAKANPAAYEPDLAGSLNSLARCLSRSEERRVGKECTG